MKVSRNGLCYGEETQKLMFRARLHTFPHLWGWITVCRVVAKCLSLVVGAGACVALRRNITVSNSLMRHFLCLFHVFKLFLLFSLPDEVSDGFAPRSLKKSPYESF
jgi:hypothetical protein